ncbi:MAG: hypothetical protein ACFCD0_04725 [Gemmataceae bacterium]
MTDQEWADNINPREMLNYVLAKCNPSNRQLRLLACGWCQGGVWSRLDDVGKNLVGLAEAHAEGLPRKQELVDAVANAPWTGGLATTVAAWTGVADIRVGVGRVGDLAIQLVAATQQRAYVPELARAEIQFQTTLLRDVFHHPSYKLPDPVRFLEWNGGTVSRMVHSIYTHRQFDLLPILADALEEAGCTDERVIGHCRSAGPHIRGCWVVDYLLGSE